MEIIYKKDFCCNLMFYISKNKNKTKQKQKTENRKQTKQNKTKRKRILLIFENVGLFRRVFQLKTADFNIFAIFVKWNNLLRIF